jgi:hypothetical protein
VFVLGLQALVLFSTLHTGDTLITPLRRKITVVLYANGLTYREGKERRAVSWERIVSVQRQPTRYWRKAGTIYHVEMSDGATLDLKKSIFAVEELGAAIERHVVERQLPGAIADYEAGRPLVFPGLCLTREAIADSEEQLRWDEVAEGRVDQEELAVKEKEVLKDWLRLPIAGLPNVCLLEELLASLKREQRFEAQVKIRGTWLL